MSVSTQCRPINKMVYLLFQHRLDFSKCLQLSNMSPQIMEGSCTKNIMMYHSRYVPRGAALLVSWHLWLKSVLLTASPTKTQVWLPHISTCSDVNIWLRRNPISVSESVAYFLLGLRIADQAFKHWHRIFWFVRNGREWQRSEWWYSL